MMMRLEATRCRDNLHLSLFLAGALAVAARLICLVGSLAQKSSAKFVQFAYCIYSRMCYTIITEREEPMSTGLVLRFSRQVVGLGKWFADLSRKDKKSVDKDTETWYNKYNKRKE